MLLRLSKARDSAKGWLRRLVLFPFLLPVFFVFHVARYFHGVIPARSVLLITGIYLAVTTVLYLLISRLLRGRLDRGLLTAMLVGLLIYWMPVIQGIGRALHIDGNYNYYPIIITVYFLAVFLIWRFARRQSAKVKDGLFYYLNTLFAIFVAVELGLIGYYALSGLHEKPLMAMNAEERPIDLRAKAGANIYLLLFDEYASAASLREDWGYDNHATDSFLRERGFFVNAKSRSNYCWTIFSMATLLHMDYFDDYRKARNKCGPFGRQQAFVAIEHARLIHILRHAGYDFKSYSIFDVADQPKQDIPDLLISKQKLITYNTFYNLLVRDYKPYLKYRSALKKNPYFYYPPYFRIDEYNNQGVSLVMREAAQPSQQPKFVYAHFMMPHGTFYYDSAEHLLSMDQSKAIPHDEEPKYYWYNVQHANKKMQAMVDSIQKHDPKATIIVLGDHGFRMEREEGRHPEYFRNMSALYFPDRNYASVPDSFSNVNVFRIVLNKVCGTTYQLLPDQQFTLIYSED